MTAGALPCGTFVIDGSPLAAAAVTHVPTPRFETRAMPLWRELGFEPVTWKPKKTLPRLSTVSGVLMKTVDA